MLLRRISWTPALLVNENDGRKITEIPNRYKIIEITSNL